MFGLVEEVLMRIRGDSSEAQEALRGVGDKSKEMEGTLSAATKALGLTAAAIGGLFLTIDRGQAVSELSASFESLQDRIGNVAGNELAELRSASQGLVSDLDLMKTANQALLAELSPDQFRQIAAAADALGDSIGVGTVEAMQQLTTMIATGNERLGKMYGITIDNVAAEEIFAKKIGITRDQLNEAGQKEAARIALLEKMQEQSEKLSGAVATSGDAFQKLGVATSNIFDRFAQAVNENQELAGAIDDLASAVNSIDVTSITKLAGILASIASVPVSALFSIGEALGHVAFNIYDAAANVTLEEKIQDIDDALKKLEQTSKAHSMLGRSAEFEANLKEQIRLLKEQRSALENLMPPGVFEEINSFVQKYSTIAVSVKKTDEATTNHNRNFVREAKSSGEALSKLTKEFSDFATKVESTDLQEALKLSIEQGSSFDSLKQKLIETYYEGIVAGIEKAQQSPAVLEQARKNAEQRATAEIEAIEGKVLEAQIEANKKAQEDRDKKFQASADFFSDALYNAMTGAAFDAEDILKRFFAGIAGGFLSELSGGLFSEFGSLQGLGQQLGSSLIKGNLSGVVGGLAGGAFGSGSPAGVPGLPDLSGFPIVGGLYNSGSQLTLLEQLGPFAAAMATAYSGSRFGGDILSGEKPSWLDAGVLAPVTGGLSLLGPLAGNFFGGSRDAQQQSRDAFRDSLRNAGVTDEDDSFSLFGGGRGSLSPGGEFKGLDQGAEQFAGIGNLLQTLSNGAEGAGIADLFANALSEAESFNAAALTTTGLLEKMGFNAQTAKEALLQAFLDEKISLEDLNAEVATLNSLQIDSLPTIAEAWELLASTIDGPPRDSVKAFEIAMSTLRKNGITDMNKLLDYIGEDLGPEASEIFENLKTHGIDQFTDFSTLSVDQVVFLLNEITRLSSLIGDKYKDIGDSGESAARRISSEMDSATKKTADAGRAARKTADDYEHLNRVVRRQNSTSGVPQPNG